MSDLFKEIEQLKTRLAKNVNDVRAYNEKVTGEKTAEDVEYIERITNDITADQILIQRKEKEWKSNQAVEDAERFLNSSPGRQTQTQVTDAKREQRNLDELEMVEFRKALAGKPHRSWRTAGSPMLQGTDSVGGYLSPPTIFNTKLIEGIYEDVSVLNYCQRFPLEGSDTLTWPKVKTSPSRPSRKDETTTPDEDATLEFEQVAIKPFEMSKLAKISWYNLAVSGFRSEEWLLKEFRRLFGDAIMYDILNGRGATTYLESVGVFDASCTGHIDTGRDVTLAAEDDITATEVRTMRYSTVKARYAKGARWMFGPTGFAKLMTLQNGNADFMFQPSMQVGAPALLEGLPIDVSEFCPDTWTTGKYVGGLFNYEGYHWVEIGGLQIRVLDQLYAAAKENGYMAIAYNAGAPVKDDYFGRFITA